MKNTKPPRVGLSSCLLGDAVRWDGSHERHEFLTSGLGPHVEWVSICPEVEAGLGVPREAMAFVRSPGGLTLVERESGRDLTETMRGSAKARAETLADADLCGYVLKSGSPSCGLDGARVYESLDDFRGDGPFERSARGVFAAALTETNPGLPIVEESTLDHRGGREHFVERVFAHDRLRAADDLAAFHERHELQILSHSSDGRKRLEAIAASGVEADYAAVFAETLAVPAACERHVGTLRRAWNRVQGRLDPARRRRIDEAIRAYGAGTGDLDVPRALLAGAAREIADTVLMGQTYLEPDPRELAIRAVEIRGFAPG